MRTTSYTMDGFCLLYLLLILLMRSGDVETNPGPNTAVSTVSEMEFLKLSHAIPPSYYDAVGISLGIPLAQLHAILIQMSNNYSNAFLRVFMKWNVKLPLTNKRQLLADALRDVDLGCLSDRLLNESLIPNSTGGPSRLLQSQTKPLSPELVERCANDFKFKYRSTVCKIRVDPLDPASTVQFKDMYTNLFLQEEHGKEKRKLDYNDILDLKVNGVFPKRIMVQGEAGAGKTTFCGKIAWDWIEGRHFSHFVWVLIVPLREFKQHTIGEIAKSYLAKSNPATVSQITEYIRSNPDKVFIAFDGLDEDRGKIMKTESHQTQPNDQMQPQPTQPSVTSSEACGSSSETGDIGLRDILYSDELASCPVLVTTRPWRAVDVRSDGDLMKLYTVIHVEGFSRENLSVYIHKYFPKDEDLANRLIQFTSENDVISENMASYPIYVSMLCLMWKMRDKQKLKDMKSLKTFSQIFKEIIAFLKEHYAQKEVKKVGSPSFIAFLKKIDEDLVPIARQALDGLLENTLVFGEDDFKICQESKDTACRVGILSQEDRITADTDTNERNSHVQLPVFFPHKLFQEYMAGVHLASLYESDRNEFNRLIEQVVLPRKEEFRYLLFFTVSQNESIATHVMSSMLQRRYMNRIRASHRDLDFIVDVAFESQDRHVAALVKDRVSSEEIKLSIDFHTTAHTVAGYAFIGPHVVKLSVCSSCGPTMSLDVAEIICSMQSLKEVYLRHVVYHDNLFATLARKGNESKVQTILLDIAQCLTPASSRHLAKALCSMPNLTHLILLGRDFKEGFYSSLRSNASSIQVQTLRLDKIHCPTTASSHHLAEALGSMPNLTGLVLTRGVLNEEFCSALKANVSSIQDCFPQIRKGNFRFNEVAQDDLNSFLHTLTCLQSSTRLKGYIERKLVYHAVLWDEDCPRRTIPPSDHPQQQPMGDVHYPRRALPSSDHRQQQPVGDVHSLDSLSDHPQQQPMGDVHYPRRTLPPSDHPQQHVGNTSDTVCQFSQTHREGSSSRSRPYKRQAPSTRSRVPQDDPEIPEKQSKIDPESAEHYPRRTLPPSDYPQEHVGYTDTVHQFSQIQSTPYKSQAPSTQSRVLQDDPEIPEKQSKNQEFLRNLESDRKLDKLSKHLPHGTYTTLCTYLGIDFNEAKQILRGVTNNYQEATRDCLAQWKTRTGGNMDELEKFLQDAEAGDLVKYIK